MTDSTELNDIELNQENNTVTLGQEETFNNEPEIDIPERIPEPWESAPDNMIYPEKINDNGRLGSYTLSAEMAYRLGTFENGIPLSDVEFSDIDNWPYLKDKCPMKGLSEKKQDKLAELSMIADKFEQNKCDSMYVVSSLGFRANADRRSLQNVSNLVDIGVETQFKDYDDQFHLLSVADLETLALEIKKNGANLYSQKFTMQYQIASAQSEQDLENIQIEFTMMDFSE